MISELTKLRDKKVTEFCKKRGIDNLKIFGNPIKEFTQKDYDELSSEDRQTVKRLVLEKLERLANGTKIQAT